MKYLSETGLAHFWGKIKSHVKTAISDINIGGLNLLPNTKTYTNTTGGNSTIIDEKYKDFSVRYLDCTQLATSSYKEFTSYNSVIDVESGGTYTFSFYAKGTKIRSYFYGGSYKPIKYVSSQGTTGAVVDGAIDITLTNEWKRYWIVYTLENENTLSTSGNKNVLLRLFGGNEAYVCGLKFERGNKATDWTPAPEDMENKIDTKLNKTGDYLNVHPENSGTIIPFINNDIAFLIKRGGSAKVYYDGVEKTVNIDNVFDTSPNYWRIEPSKIPVSTLIIELTLYKAFDWQSTIYFDNGASGWRAKNVKIEVMNSNYADDVWTKKYENTNLTAGNARVTFYHRPVGTTNDGPGFNKIRFTFTNWNNAGDFRIAQLGVIGYSSLGTRNTTMSRGIDDTIFRSITPYYNDTYNLGSSTNKWREVHATSFKGNADTATNPKSNQLTNTDLNTLKVTGFYYAGGNNSCTNKPSGVDAFGLICYQSAGGFFVQELESSNNNPMTKYIRQWNNSTWSAWTEMKYTDTTYSDATTSASGLMSSTDKTKLDGLQNYSNATTSASGLMSAADKYKLDSMPSGGAFNPDRVLNVSYNSSTQKLTVSRIVNGQTITPPDTLNIHEGHSNFKRKVLYNDAAGTNGNVTLSEQKDNFDELVIVYGFANNEGIIVYKTETMPVVDGKQGFQLEYKYWTAVGKEANAHAIYITENGSTTLVVGHKDKYVLTTSGDVQASSSSLGYIKIYKVYGIKYV